MRQRINFVFFWLCMALTWSGHLHAQTPSFSAGQASGQWFDRFHNGHGLDINRAGGIVFGTFYTYAPDGRSEWLWLQMPQADVLNGNFTRYRKIGTAPPVAEVVGQFNLQAVTQCADGIARPGARALLEFRFSLPQGSQVWCLEPLLPDTTVAEQALDGHWYVPDSDSGWGLVTHYYGNAGSTQAFHSIYFFDGTGYPRWAVANATVSGFQQRIDFYTLQGSCFGCATNNVSAAPIGFADLTLRSPQLNHQNANQINLSLRVDSNSSFIRSGRMFLLSAAKSVPLIRSSAQGLIKGQRVSDAVERFSNIPFAAAPISTLRFRAPQITPLRQQTLDATTVGPGCIQPSGLGLFSGAPAQQSEDCLQLNIWQPVISNATAPLPVPLPVMVWIHGGGLTIGSAVEQVSGRLVYDGAKLAEKGVVVVSINYRLGPFGYLGLRPMVGENADQPSAGNYGLLDQIAALKWVRDNIAQFGGDPNAVTIFGESAGGISTCALIASPLARGLFARAISQSGNCLTQPKTIEATLSQGDRITAAAGCANLDANASKTCLRNLSASALLSASNAAINLGVTATGESYGLTVDAFSLIESPASAVSSGRAAQVPLMLGVNDDESTSTTPASTLPATAAGYEALVRSQFTAIADLVLARYPVASYASPPLAYQDLLDDVRFVCANRRAATDHSARGNAVFHYALTDTLPDPQLAPLQSYHGLDIIFLFGRSAGLAAELDLREKMQTAWTNFAKTADPGNALGYPWPRYDSQKRSAELNSAARAVLTDYRGDYCAFWARYVAL
jgi:para-nitrobenzyl esterase